MATKSLGTLTLDLVAKIGGYTEGLDKAGREAEKLSARQKKAAAESEKAWKAAGVSIGLAFSAVALGAVALIKNSIDAADALNDLSKTTGVSVEDLSGLSLAAKQSGTDLEGVADSVSKLSVNMGKDSEKFKKMGIDAKEPLEAFKQLADVFVSIEDPQQRAAFAAEALGKSWKSAAPLLSEGGKAIGEMVDRGKELSGVTQDMANEADKFNDQLEELKASASGFGIALTKEVLPGLNQTIDRMKEAYVESGKLASALEGFYGLGAFLFSDEFASGAVKLGNLRDELNELEKERKQREATPGLGLVGNILFGQSDSEISRRIAEIKYETKVLEDLAKPKAKPPAAEVDPGQAKKLCEFSGGKWDGSKCLPPGSGSTTPKISEFQKYVESLEKQIGKVENLTSAETVLAEVQSGRLGKLTDQQKTRLILLGQEVDAAKLNAEAWSFVQKSIEDAAEATQALLLENQKAAESYRDLIDPAREISREMEKIQALVDEGFLTPDEGFEAQILKLKDSYKELGKDMDEFAKNAAENIQEAIGDGLVDILDGNFKTIGSSFGKMIKQMTADAIAANIARALFGDKVKGGSGSGGAGDFLSIVGSIFGLSGALASGGPTQAGGTYLVGEQGPELFTSNTSGYVMNAQQTAALSGSAAGDAISGTGGLTYAPVIQIDSRTDRAQIMQEVERANKIASAELVDQLQRAGRL